MIRALKITIEEIDYYIEVDWSCGEYPVVNDYVRIMELCTAEQRKEFEGMAIPKYLRADFPNLVEYLRYYRWQVVERCWQANDRLSINCRRVDPVLL